MSADCYVTQCFQLCSSRFKHIHLASYVEVEKLTSKVNDKHHQSHDKHTS